MKRFIAAAVALWAALVSAEMPVITELPGIPDKYCGTFYLHRKMVLDNGGTAESFAPAKPFGKIEAKQVVLADGRVLKVTKFIQMETLTTFAGQHRKIIIVKFEQTDFVWGFAELPDSTMQIMQTGLKMDPLKMGKLGTIFTVSQNKDRQLDPMASMKMMSPVAPSHQPPPFTGEVETGVQYKAKEACYIDCWPDSVVLMPGSIKVALEELQQPTNAVEKFLDGVQQQSQTTYAVVIARPDSVNVFRQVRKMIARRSIDCAYDVLASNVPLGLHSQSATTRRMAHTGNQQPVYFECRADQVFYIDKAELDEKVQKLLFSMPAETRSGNPTGFVNAINSNEVGNAYYKVMPSYLLAMIMALEPKPGAHGDDSNALEDSNSQFQRCLKKCNPQAQYAVFLVRSDSFNIFRQAREIAGQFGFETGFETLNADEPIKFGTGGTVVPTK